ncbi:MAG TPA: hypothetical protein VHG08_17975 [Longimicrobium sp.]|nr:hypothetical protein [Longimicrobium sp.]
MELPYYVHPGTQHAGAPILLFLHGIGEGFDNNGERQTQRLFQQGPPKFIAAAPDDHVLRTSFTLIAPQLPDRPTSWASVGASVKRIVDRHRPGAQTLYLAGFSKGGLGALELAELLSPAALLTADASPMDADPAQKAGECRRALGTRPLWAIYTNYVEGVHKQWKFQAFNEALLAQVHGGLDSPPAQGAQVRTLVQAGAHVNDPVQRHVAVSDRVFLATAPYEWLLLH